LPILKIWADPIVAKGYVKSEVLHYSRSIVAIISHVQEVSLAQYKMKIVEMVWFELFYIFMYLTLEVSLDCQRAAKPSFKYRSQNSNSCQIHLWLSHPNDAGKESNCFVEEASYFLKQAFFTSCMRNRWKKFQRMFVIPLIQFVWKQFRDFTHVQ